MGEEEVSEPVMLIARNVGTDRPIDLAHTRIDHNHLISAGCD